MKGRFGLLDWGGGGGGERFEGLVGRWCLEEVFGRRGGRSASETELQA